MLAWLILSYYLLSHAAKLLTRECFHAAEEIKESM